MKWTKQIKYCTSSGKRILGMIARFLKKLKIDSLKTLCRPEKYMAGIEKVQKKAKKIISSLRRNNYSKRLLELNLTDLKIRR